ncbi:MAG: hypothetical protein ACLP05_06550 [Candidatus Kryptoniota bacterium]
MHSAQVGDVNYSQEITAKASCDKSEYLVGDYIAYTIQVDYDKSLTILQPIMSDSLKNISIIRKGGPIVEEGDKNATVTYKYILSGYDSTGVLIPPTAVPYHTPGDTTIHYAATNSVDFTIRTLPVNLKKDIQDVKSPLRIPLDWRWILLWVLAGSIVVVIISLLHRRYKKKKSGMMSLEKIVKIPPHEIALNALHELEKQRLWRKGLIKEYHSAITEIIRRYFKDRFDLPALELTTSETVELIKQRQGTGPILETTHDFLSNADLVKFAKFTPLDSVNEEMMKQAYEIVNKTIPTVEAEKDVRMAANAIQE